MRNTMYTHTKPMANPMMKEEKKRNLKLPSKQTHTRTYVLSKMNQNSIIHVHFDEVNMVKIYGAII